MRALIFGNAAINDYKFCMDYVKNSDAVICCDGGMRHSFKLGIKPDYILGDFDSAEPEILKYYKNQNIEIKSFPSKKDKTDMEICLDFIISLGFKEAVILGAIGSRFDHTLANAQLLYEALSKGVQAVLVNENNSVRIIKDSIVLYGQKGDTVSLIPFSKDVEGVSTNGLEYPLVNETLYAGSSRGVSNVFSSDSAEIKILKGYLFVICSKD